MHFRAPALPVIARLCWLPIAASVCLTTALAQDALDGVSQQVPEEMASEDPEAWRRAAAEARDAGDFESAAAALARAEALGLSPVSGGLERARLWTVRGNAAAATAELRTLLSGGFSSVNAVRNDPVLSTLRGEPAFEAVLADMEKVAYPCAHEERFRAFDFWIGEWDVHLANGTLAGTNTIQSQQRGCVLVENWLSATGGTGQSINFLDGATGEWVQVWNDAAGTQIDIRGGMTDQGMLLKGKIHYLGGNTSLPFRGLWTLLPDGRVRQFFEQSSDDEATWVPWFEGFYARRRTD